MKKLLMIIIAGILAVSICACGASQPQATEQAAADGVTEAAEAASAAAETVEASAGAEAQTTAAEAGDAEATEAADLDIISENTNPVAMEDIKDNLEKASAYIESVADTSNMTVTTDDENEESIYRYWQFDEAIEDAPLSNEVEVDGHTIIIGTTTVEEVEAFGYDVEEAKETVEPDEVVSVTLNQGDKYFSLETSSTENESAVPIGGLPIYGFAAATKDYSIPFSYAGLTHGATLEEVIAVLGMPGSGINLSADAIGTSIELAYFNDTAVDDMLATDSLSVFFLYDKESNTATLSNMSFSKMIYSEEDE